MKTHSIRDMARAAATPCQLATSSYTPSGYAGAELKPYAERPDAVRATALPSRTGNRLRYPGGRVTDLAGNPVNDNWSPA